MDKRLCVQLKKGKKMSRKHQIFCCVGVFDSQSRQNLTKAILYMAFLLLWLPKASGFSEVHLFIYHVLKLMIAVFLPHSFSFPYR